MAAGLGKAVVALLGSRNEQRRHEWVNRQLASLPEGARLLDAGAGEQRYRPATLHLDYVSQDFAQYEGHGNGQGLQTGRWDVSRTHIISDITAIPEPDASFDAILCTEVIEHVPNPVAALRELARLVKPDGVLIVTAPFASLTHFAPFHYCTGFDRYFYQYWLPQLGFTIEAIEPNGDFIEFVCQELMRIPKLPGLGGVRRLVVSVTAVLTAAALKLLSLGRCTGSELLCFGYHIRARRLASSLSSVAQVDALSYSTR